MLPFVRPCRLLLTVSCLALCATLARSATPTVPGPPEKSSTSSTTAAQGTRLVSHETAWLIGDASIQNAAESQVPASGSIGLQFISEKRIAGASGSIRPSGTQQVSLFYAFASTSDTVLGSTPAPFGATLAPQSVVGHKISFFVDYSYLWNYEYRGQGRQGIRAYAGLTQMAWGFDSLGTTVAGDVVPYTAGVRYVINPINKSPDDARVSVTAEAGPTFRFLDYAETSSRVRALATRGETSFWGVDLYTALQIRDLIVSAYVPWFWRSRKLPGLTDSGFRVQLGLQAPLVKLFADPEDNSAEPRKERHAKPGHELPKTQ